MQSRDVLGLNPQVLKGEPVTVRENDYSKYEFVRIVPDRVNMVRSMLAQMLAAFLDLGTLPQSSSC